MLKIVSFNINGIRARPHQLEALKQRHDPDILGIQECKVADPEFPRESVESLDFVPEFHGQKGHYGVALLSRLAPLEVIRGLPGDAPDAQLVGGAVDLQPAVGVVVEAVVADLELGGHRRGDRAAAGGRRGAVVRHRYRR